VSLGDQLPTIPLNRGRRATDPGRRRIWGGRIGGIVVVAAVAVIAGNIGRNTDTNKDLATQTALIRKTAEDLKIAQAKIDGLQAQTNMALRRVIGDGCDELEIVKGKLRRIILRGDRNIRSFYADGAISRAQLERSLKDSRDARRDLGSRDCTSLAAEIPLG